MHSLGIRPREITGAYFQTDIELGSRFESDVAGKQKRRRVVSLVLEIAQLR